MGAGTKTPSSQVAITIEAPAWSKKMPDVTAVAARVVDAVLALAGPHTVEESHRVEIEVSMLLTDDETVRKLNAQYRGKDTPTNVLSFPVGTGAGPLGMESIECGPPVFALGDVVLAFETVVRECEMQAKVFSDHVTHLMVHGVLHLLGHDHERIEDADRMEGLEATILGTLGISDPYRCVPDSAENLGGGDD